MPELTAVYRCAGLRIESPVPLSGPLDSNPPDVTLVQGNVRPVELRRPSVDVVAERVVRGLPWYTFSRHIDGSVTARFYRLVDFEIDHSHRNIVWHADPATSPGLIPIIVAGSLTAYLLSARGQLVLHSSAVEIESAAVGFIGESGQGKTTVAALLAATGCPLVTDDLLPLIPDEGERQVLCVPGGIELRLRRKSGELAGRFREETARRVTEDDRIAVSPRLTDRSLLKVSMLVIPHPERSLRAIDTTVLSKSQAIIALGRLQRIDGWRSPTDLRAQFSEIAAVVQYVPVVRSRIPWGPPFSPELGEELLKDLRGTLAKTRGVEHT